MEYIRYLNPANHHQERIRKADKDFAKKSDFKEIKFPDKIRDIHWKKRIPSALVFSAIKIKKIIQYMYKNNVVKKNMMIYY